jgi:hypothetical protein
MDASAPLGFGALPVERGVRFRLAAPRGGDVRLVLHDGRAAGDSRMPAPVDGIRELVIEGAAAGDR